MRENVLDVLMYLFETYMDSDIEEEPDRSELRDELEQAGFNDLEIDRALEWLDGLTSGQEAVACSAPTERATRLFDSIELSRLDSICRGFLLYLEQLEILSASQRELVIDRLMALGNPDIDVEQIKWVVLMVLFGQPGQESAYARMEDLVFDETMDALH
jgi:Smg protein